MNNTSPDRTHYIACNLCEAICGLEIEIENNEVRSIKGDKQDPISKGHICPKAIALQDVYNDPDRLRSPIRKTGDGWQAVSWKQAFKEVTTRLKQIQHESGNDAVAIYLGNPTVHNLDALLFGPAFFRALQTRNRYSATSVDQLPEQLVSLLMFGHSLMIPLPDIDRTGFHVILGANPVVSNGSLMTAPGISKRLKAIRERGGKLIVIDPRKTETAAIANQHVFIKPGSDVFMLLAMLQVVFSENLQTLGSVAGFTSGMDKIEALVKDFCPEKVAPLTGVNPLELKTLVREFCDADSASCYGRIGVSTQQYGTLSQWLITVFNIVTGNLDVPGGSMFSRPAFEILTGPPSKRNGFAQRLSRVRQLPNFNGEFPVAALAEEITTRGDGQIRALVTSAGNPVLSTPNGNQLDNALGKLDYMVSIDLYLNETTRHANIILPPPCSLERSQYDLAFQALAVRNAAKYSEPVFRPVSEQRSDAQIFLELAWHMQDGNWFRKASGWVKKEILQKLGSGWIINKKLKQGPYHRSHGLNLKQLKKNPHGIDLGAMQPCLPDRLFTADKTINLAPEACLSELQKLQQDIFTVEASAKTAGFDLQLIGRRDPRTNNSWLHNSHRMVKGKERCVALVHPLDAASRSLSDGDIAVVRSRVGVIRIPITISADMLPGVISIPHGWGHQMEGIKLDIARAHAGVNVNILTDDYFLDSISGNAALNGVAVSLSPGSL
jgi:anaerobic selenocysteine-containing dehydrogenase